MPFAASSGLSLPSVERELDELRRDAGCLDAVDLAVQEREPPRLAFLDDRDFDPLRERERLVLHRARDRLPCRRHRTRRHVGDAAEVGIGLEHDARAALVLAEPVGTGADRMRADVQAVRLDDLARHRGQVRHRKHVRKSKVRRLQADPQRVAVDDFEARQRRVVVELAGLARALLRLVAADELAFEQPRPWRLRTGSRCRLKLYA